MLMRVPTVMALRSAAALRMCSSSSSATAAAAASATTTGGGPAAPAYASSDKKTATAAAAMDGYVTPDQARLSFEATSDPQKSPVARQTAKVAKAGRVSRTINDDGTVTGMRSLWQGWPMYAAALFVLATYLVVTKTEEQQIARRHTSIEKDIARERWRAQELGLASADDGFADKYMTKLNEEKNKGGVFNAGPTAETVKVR